MARGRATYAFLNKDTVITPSEVFDRRVTFQSLVATGGTDSLGNVIKNWQDVVSTWAHIEPWKGSESFTADQVYPFTWVRTIIRYRPSFNLDASMQMVYGTRKYNVRSVFVPAEAQRVIELLCQELQALGSLH